MTGVLGEVSRWDRCVVEKRGLLACRGCGASAAGGPNDAKASGRDGIRQKG
jgi:hypothetical protein